MKLTRSLAIAVASTTFAATEAFVPAFVRSSTSTTQLFERPDASPLIEKALAASKEYGPASPEARLAWEAVEELDSSDNSVVTQGGLDEECELEDTSAKCMDYGQKLDELTELVQAHGPMVQKMQELASEIQSVRLSTPKVNAGAAKESPAFKKALAEAKAASAEFGATSPEARVAWDNVEEVAAAESHAVQTYNNMDLDEQCLVDSASQACQAMEELRRVIDETSEKKISLERWTDELVHKKLFEEK